MNLQLKETDYSGELIMLDHDLNQYPYIRKSAFDMIGRRRDIEKYLKNGIGDFYKLIAYQYKGQSGQRYYKVYNFDVYWLKKHDKNCPNQHLAPRYADGTSQPCEAMPTAALLNGTYSKYDRL